MHRAGRLEDVKIFEYRRPEWTWHAKGIWMQSPDQQQLLTCIGSSNLNDRSLKRDLEAQLYIITREPKLTESIRRELRDLSHHSFHVSRQQLGDRKVPKLLKVATKILRNML